MLFPQIDPFSFSRLDFTFGISSVNVSAGRKKKSSVVTFNRMDVKHHRHSSNLEPRE